MYKIKKHPWIILVIGLVLGVALFAIFNYFNSAQQRKISTVINTPIAFDISPYDHILGDYDAPQTIVVFNDFTCPYCQDYAATLENLSQKYSGQVRIIWKQFPLNKDYLGPAIASECANEQDKFWDYARLLYTHTGEYDNSLYLNFAEQTSLDMAQFDSCLSGDKYKAKIIADYYEGIMRGVIGSPATFINGYYIPGAIPFERLEEILKFSN